MQRDRWKGAALKGNEEKRNRSGDSIEFLVLLRKNSPVLPKYKFGDLHQIRLTAHHSLDVCAVSNSHRSLHLKEETCQDMTSEGQAHTATDLSVFADVLEYMEESAVRPPYLLLIKVQLLLLHMFH